MKSQTLGLILIGIFITTGIYFFVSNSKISKHTIPVLSRPSTITGREEYYLYVPGSKSSCTWSYKVNYSGEEKSDYPDNANSNNGQHTFEFDPTGISNIHVSCLNDQGTMYTGEFSN